ncbi:MAG: cytochrome ubiquinol oxidase subunit I [Nitrospirota bacterium]
MRPLKLLSIFVLFLFLCLGESHFSFAKEAIANNASPLYAKGDTASPTPAPKMSYPESYGGFQSVNHRALLWIFIQQHFYLGSFIIGTPMIAWLIELFAFYIGRKKMKEWQALDKIAYHIMQIGFPFYTFTIISGIVLLCGFAVLYPIFSRYMAGLFRPIFYLYALAFFLESLLFYAYSNSWRATIANREKVIHLGVGFLLCLNGILIICLANALMSFMMSPKGIDASGRFLGNLWEIVHTPFWNPLNVHRVMASIMFSGAVIAAYAAFRMLRSSDLEERAYFDRMGHITILLAITNLCLLPMAGYWFAKEIFIFRQRMGMTLMGGELSWLFVVQAMLLGFIFMTVIHYLWQGTTRMEGAHRYRPFSKYLLLLFLISFLIWTTPHTLPATSTEFQQMGGSQHPIIGYYGTMGAKNTAINTMILTFSIAFIIFKRCNKEIMVSWRRFGNGALFFLFGMAEVMIIVLGVYGHFIPANIRVSLAFPQFIAAISALILGVFLNFCMLKGAKTIGPIQWGNLPRSGAISLFVLALLIATTMALMGYIRSSVRLNWHITEIMEDVTPWSQAFPILQALGMVLFNVFLFLLLFVLIFRFAQSDCITYPESDLSKETDQVSSHEVLSS